MGLILENQGEGDWILFEFKRRVKERFVEIFSDTGERQFMRNAVMIRCDLTPHEKFQAFFSELINYLRKNLAQLPRFPNVPESVLLCACLENFTKIMNGCGDLHFEWAMYSKRFS